MRLLETKMVILLFFCKFYILFFMEFPSTSNHQTTSAMCTITTLIFTLGVSKGTRLYISFLFVLEFQKIVGAHFSFNVSACAGFLIGLIFTQKWFRYFSCFMFHCFMGFPSTTKSTVPRSITRTIMS